MEAKTMISESGWGPAVPSPVTSAEGDHSRPGPPAVTQSGLGLGPQSGPAAAQAGSQAGVSAGAPPLEPTGDERVDEAVARLGELGGAPVARHVEIFEDVHRRLQDVLDAIDQNGPAQAGPAEAGPVQAGPVQAGAPAPRPPGPGVPPPAGRPGGN
jgi:hypothetical protein